MNVTINGVAYKKLRFDGAWFFFEGNALVYEVFGETVYCHVPARDGSIVPVRVEGEEALSVKEALL